MLRLLGLLATLFLLAYGALLTRETSDRAWVPAEPISTDRGFERVSAFEPAVEPASSQAPVSPADVDDDDDDDDDQDLVAQTSRVVAWHGPLAPSLGADLDGIQPSCGHPPGIDDPPRS